MMDQRVEGAAANPSGDGDSSNQRLRNISNILAEMDWSACDGEQQCSRLCSLPTFLSGTCFP
jgi:hypothetical protein